MNKLGNQKCRTKASQEQIPKMELENQVAFLANSLESDGGPSERETASQPSEDRHRRKCQICHHPDRDLIEDAFVRWSRPHAISSYYSLPDGCLERHARAAGLYALRQRNLRAALDNILQRSTSAKVTGDTVIRAVRAYACLTEDNRWVEPATRVVFSTQHNPIPVAQPVSATFAESTPSLLPEGSNQVAASSIPGQAAAFLIHPTEIRK